MALSLSPITAFNFGRACRFQDGSDIVDTRLDGMDRKQDRPSFNRGLQRFGSSARNSRAAQRSRDTTGHMAGSLTESRRKRAGRHNWSDSRKHSGNSGEKVTGQLAKTGGGPGVLDVGA